MSNSKDLADLCQSYVNCGRAKELGGQVPGHNYRLTDIQGAILQVQLDRFTDEHYKVRQENASYLTEELSKIEGIQPISPKPDQTHCSYYTYLFKCCPEYFNEIPREKFIEALWAEGIACTADQTGAVYEVPEFVTDPRTCPLAHSYYEENYRKIGCSSAEKLAHEQTCRVPHQALLATRADMDDIIEVVQKVKDNIHELEQD